MGGVRYTHDTYVAKVSLIFPDYEIVSDFIKTNMPISYICDKGHSNSTRANILISGHGCKQCMHNTLADIHRLKPFLFTPRVERIKLNKTYILPPPFNTYKAKYLGKGNWQLNSSRGIMRPSLKDKYIQYGLCDTSQQLKVFGLHQIIYAIKNNNWKFLSYIKRGYEIDHIDRNPSNNKIKNLRLVTASKNMRNREVSYIQDVETLSWVCKERIKGRKQKDIANELGCHYTTISDAISGRTHQELIPLLPKNLIKQARAVLRQPRI
jgi:hypothetical protein